MSLSYPNFRINEFLPVVVGCSRVSLTVFQSEQNAVSISCLSSQNLPVGIFFVSSVFIVISFVHSIFLDVVDLINANNRSSTFWKCEEQADKTNRMEYARCFSILLHVRRFSFSWPLFAYPMRTRARVRRMYRRILAFHNALFNAVEIPRARRTINEKSLLEKILPRTVLSP